MSMVVYPWEQRLLEQAYEAFESSGTYEPIEVEEQVLEQAYSHCESLIKNHSRTFYLTSGLLSAAKRRAARALYAFCRISDDLVDCAEGDLRAGLETWRQRALWGHNLITRGDTEASTSVAECSASDDRGRTSSLSPEPGCGRDLIALAWADARIRYGIPPGYAEQLVEGVARDLVSTRYTTFEELAGYCYGVAATVGLMVMYIIGFSGPEAIPYAVKLGVALQLTNILRDVGEDWRAGRIYLPQDELAAFGLTESDIASGNADDRWRAFMSFQIERNRRLYTEALPGIALLDPDGRFAIAAAAELYRAILEDIEAHDGDVFHRRAYVSTWGKLRRLPGIWWRARTLSYSKGSLECQEI